MKRVVLDTNVLVAAAHARWSASRQILDACGAGVLVMIVSESLLHEYRATVARAVPDREERQHIESIYLAATRVTPTEMPRVVPGDIDDDKLIATALAGQADALITADRHLLALDPFRGIAIIRPALFVNLGVIAD